MNTKTVLGVISLTLLVVGLTFASISAPAFANKKNTPQDDKNNPTYPGTGAGNNQNPSDQAFDNAFDNCVKHNLPSSSNLPAQCQ
jgi:hypothetical protein